MPTTVPKRFRFAFLYPPEGTTAWAQSAYYRGRLRLGQPAELELHIDYTRRTVSTGASEDAGGGVDTYPLPRLTNFGQGHFLDWLRQEWASDRAKFLQINPNFDSYDPRAFDVRDALFTLFGFYTGFTGTDRFPIVEIVGTDLAPDQGSQITDATSDEDIAYFVEVAERALRPARPGNLVLLQGAREEWTAERDRHRDLVRDRLTVVATSHREMETERDFLIMRLGAWGDTSRNIGRRAALSHTSVQRIIAAGRRS